MEKTTFGSGFQIAALSSLWGSTRRAPRSHVARQQTRLSALRDLDGTSRVASSVLPDRPENSGRRSVPVGRPVWVATEEADELCLRVGVGRYGHARPVLPRVAQHLLDRRHAGEKLGAGLWIEGVVLARRSG